MLIVFLALQACVAKATSAAQPLGTSLPLPIGSANDLNQSLNISVDTPPPYRLGTEIEFEATNMSQYKIQMTPDLGAKLFLRVQNGWTQIGNNDRYHGDLVLFPQRPGELRYQFSSGVWPVLNDGVTLWQDQTLRIYIQGTMLSPSNEQDRAVGAYVDITLSP